LSLLLLPLAGWIGAGWLLRRAGLPARAVVGLNRFIVWVPLPATILLAIHGLRWESSFWVPVSMAWIVFAAAAAAFSAAGRAFGWPPRTVGALLLAAGLGNTSFIGYPLLRALYGEGAIAVAVLTDQPGSFLVLATLGIAAASYFSSSRPSGRALLSRVARFPPIWALLAAVALRPVAFGPGLEGVLGLGRTLLIPLALVSVGAQLRFDRARMLRERGPLLLGLGFKLVLAPLLIALLFAGALRRTGPAVRITILEAAMGPMITGAIVADEYALDSELASLLVSLGIPLCLLTVPLWAKLLETLGV
jgi:predicted permease